MNMVRPIPPLTRLRRDWGERIAMSVAIAAVVLLAYAAHPLLSVFVLCALVGVLVEKIGWLQRRLERIEARERAAARLVRRIG